MKVKKILAGVLSMAGVVSLLAGLMTMTASADDEVRYNYIYDFSDAEQMKDFTAYYLEQVGDTPEQKVGAEEAYTNHWELKDGKLIRSNVDIGNDPSTQNRNAMLFLNDRFTYFEAEMSFRFGSIQEDHSWGWAQLCFGAQEKGNHMHHNNAGIFMQMQGYVNLSFPGDQNWADESKAYTPDFKKENLHTYKLRVTQGDEIDQLVINWYCKENDGEYVHVLKDYVVTYPDMANNGGYISIQAQNDDVSIESLAVRRLTYYGAYEDESLNPTRGTTEEPTTRATTTEKSTAATTSIENGQPNQTASEDKTTTKESAEKATESNDASATKAPTNAEVPNTGAISRAWPYFLVSALSFVMVAGVVFSRKTEKSK